MTLTSGAHPVPGTETAEYAVRLRNVVKQFTADGPIVLDDLTLDVRPGEFISLVGASGCGKSTLLNIISGLDRQTSGVVETSGRPAFMFQEGGDPVAESAFREVARLSRGAYCKFDPGSAAQLAELLRAVAAYAAGGMKALANLKGQRSAMKLLEQLK